MKRLKTILQCDNFFRVIVSLVLIYSLIITLLPSYKSKYNSKETNFLVTLTDFKIDGNKLSLELKGKEKLIGTYYINREEEKNYYEKNLKLGTTLNLKGELTEASNNTVPNLFNYKKYLYNQKIYYTLNVSNLEIINETNNIFYKLKNLAYKRANNIKNNNYIYAYILGKTDKISEHAIESYRTNGISHLFALSGLHVSIFSLVLLKILQKLKLKETLSYIITFIFLLIFSFITGFSPSILRASLLFFLLGINKIYKLNIKTINVLCLVFIILVLINPFIIYNTSFILSFTTTFFLILGSKFINSKNYLKGLLLVSTFSFISNIGVSIYFFNYINPLGIIMNLIFVPLISFIIFPLSIIVYILPFLSDILFFITNLMENISITLSKINLTIYFSTLKIYEVIIYYILLLTILKTKKKKYIIFLVLLIIFYKTKPYLTTETRVYFIDVGQGDSALIVTPHNKTSILIDTGGKVEYKTEKWKETTSKYQIYKDTLIPFMRSIGLTKLDYLFITHGDQDHAGEAQNLIENFKVDKVFINKGEINDLERKIKEKEIINFDTLKIDNVTLYSLNNEIYKSENDNSIVLLAHIDNTTILFTADASIQTENDILKNYTLNKIDILKVGHHGSKTSSSKKFINAINPKYSLISVGKNNKYGHPDEEVLNNLEDSKIYRTDIDGSILFKIKKYKLEIETYIP